MFPKVIFPLILFMGSFGWAELPNDSFPLHKYAHCEDAGGPLSGIRSFLKNDPWAYALDLNGAQLSRAKKWQEGGFVAVPDGELLALSFYAREYRCVKLEETPIVYRWFPIVQDESNAMTLKCETGKYWEAIKMARYNAPVRSWRRGLAPYTDRWSEIFLSVPLKKCLSKKEYKRFKAGEEVEVRFKTFYRPKEPDTSFGWTIDSFGPKERWLPRHRVIIKVKGEAGTLNPIIIGAQAAIE